MFKLTFHKNKEFWGSEQYAHPGYNNLSLTLVIKYFWNRVNYLGRPEKEIVVRTIARYGMYSMSFEDKNGFLIGLILECHPSDPMVKL